MPAPIPKEKREEVYLMWLSGRYTIKEILSLSGVSNGTLFNIVNEYKRLKYEKQKL